MPPPWRVCRGNDKPSVRIQSQTRRADPSSFDLAHGALETEQQSVIEQGGMIEAVSIADERVGEAAEIEQAIPVGVIAGEAGDLKTEHDSDMPERNLGGEACKSVALDDAGSGNSEVLVDDDNLL